MPSNRQLHGDLLQLQPGNYPDRDPRLALTVGLIRQFHFTRTFTTAFRGKPTTSPPVVFILGEVPEMDLAAARKKARFIDLFEKMRQNQPRRSSSDVPTNFISFIL